MTASPSLADFGPGIALRGLFLACRRILPLASLVLAGALAQGASAADGGAGQAPAAGEEMLEHVNQALREREIELASLRGQLARLEQVNRDAEAARNLLMVENAKFVVAIAQERARAEANEEALRDELDALRKSNESSQAALGGENARLAQELTQAREAAAAASRELAVAQAAQRQSAGDVARLTEASARLEGQVESQNALHAKALAAIEAGSGKLHSENEALQSRLLEVQAKLSELDGQFKTQGQIHADARKAADAAAARLKGEKEGLESSLAQAQEKAADVEQRLKTLVEAHAGAVAALERLQKDKADLQDKVEADEKAVTELVDRLGQAEQRAAALAQRAEESAKAAVAQKDALAQELAQVKQVGAEERKRLQARLAEVQTGLAHREPEPAPAPAPAPVDRPEAAVGGAPADEQLRQQAAGQLADLRKLYKRRGGMKAEVWNQERERLEAGLRDRQSLLAQSLGARRVYRVEPNDTLAKISLDVYGKATRWPEIFAANRHLLADPAKLVPGMALVIP